MKFSKEIQVLNAKNLLPFFYLMGSETVRWKVLWRHDLVSGLQIVLHCSIRAQAPIAMRKHGQGGALVKHKVYVASTPADHCVGEFSIDVEKLS